MSQQEIESLQAVQRECARQHQAASTQRERDWCMLGIADYLMEEILILREDAANAERAGTSVQCETEET